MDPLFLDQSLVNYSRVPRRQAINARQLLVCYMLLPSKPTTWSVEAVGITPGNNPNNTFLDTYINSSVDRLFDGSYRAQFSWKDSHPPLPTVVHIVQFVIVYCNRT